MVVVVVLSLHTAGDAVTRQMDGNDVAERVWFIGK
jgi:hypothetical protein